MPTSADAPPEVRPKRPIYRSYGELIKVLTDATMQRVRSEKAPAVPPLVVTAPMRQLGVQIVRLRRVLKAKERTLEERFKAHVPDRYYPADVAAAVTLEYTYSERNRLTEARPANYQARLDAIKRLRIQASLDTIDMTPRQAKHYLLRLEKRLAKV